MYGWMTNSGIKFVIVVDMAGRVIRDAKQSTVVGIKDADLKPVSNSWAQRLTAAILMSSRRFGPFRTPM